MLWFNDNREKIKADNPGISFTDIAKKGGELWKNLDDKSVSCKHISVIYCRGS